ncbi:MAG: UbiA family prenyltransferase, partial [Gammaproteobacteria bacterium]
LTKPKVVLLMLITSLVGMFLATRAGVPWTVLLFGNLGIALCAGGAAAVNHVVDRQIDSVMARTHKRPLAEGRVSPAAALTFAFVLGVSGLALLLTFTNALAAWLTLASLIGYAVIYTGFLKRATPQNIVIGGLAGALPPVIGWAAASGAGFDPQRTHRWFIAAGIAWSALLLAVLHGPAWLRAPFSSRPMRWAGVVSFSAYLWHMPVID